MPQQAADQVHVQTRGVERFHGERVPGDVHTQRKGKSQFPSHLVQGDPDGSVPVVDGLFQIAKGLDAEFYFSRPYHSWERGANENTNGLIRQYIPKGTDFSELTDEMLAEIEWKLNHRPRKSLGYRTPLEYCKQLFNFDF